MSDTTQNALINIVTIFLGLGVGSKLQADSFLTVQTIGILLLGAFAFSIGTASGVSLYVDWNGEHLYVACDPAADKDYRHASHYPLPAEVDHM